MYHIILAIIILVLTSIWLNVVEWVTFTEEELQIIDQRSYDWPKKLRSNSDQQELVTYARNLTKNIDFILTIERESWFRRDAKGDWLTSYWLCQWHNPGKKEWRLTSTDPALKDWYSMIDKCRESRQIKGKRVWSWLHWYAKRHEVKDRFTFNR
jgi:hypothetical protein